MPGPYFLFNLNQILQNSFTNIHDDIAQVFGRNEFYVVFISLLTNKITINRSRRASLAALSPSMLEQMQTMSLGAGNTPGRRGSLAPITPPSDAARIAAAKARGRRATIGVGALELPVGAAPTVPSLRVRESVSSGRRSSGGSSISVASPIIMSPVASIPEDERLDEVSPEAYSDERSWTKNQVRRLIHFHMIIRIQIP